MFKFLGYFLQFLRGSELLKFLGYFLHFLWGVQNCWNFCSQQSRSQGRTHMPWQVSRFIFNLRKKSRISHLHNCTANYKCTYKSYLSWLATDNLYILERINVVTTAANKSILAPFSKQTEPLHPPCELGRFGLLPTQKVWLGLPRSCYSSKSQTQELINHTDTHHG